MATVSIDEKKLQQMIVDAVATGIKNFSVTRPRPSFVTKTEAAKMLDVSAGTITNMIKRGELKQNRLGKIPIESIDSVLQKEL